VAIGADGYVDFRGRADDLMNAQGYRVSPLEVESVVAAHPFVAEVAVAEREVRPGVRIVTAWVVPRGDLPLDVPALLAYAAEHLAAYKCPRDVVTVERLPRTPNGKLLRRNLPAS
jgi:acyl-coenzyme A synthetase/AMP-(fatty) acid ligase